jgi:hypothetical protein
MILENANQKLAQFNLQWEDSNTCARLLNAEGNTVAWAHKKVMDGQWTITFDMDLKEFLGGFDGQQENFETCVDFMTNKIIEFKENKA